MALSISQKKKLNKMNRAAQEVQLGTMLSNLNASGSVIVGTATVTDAQVNASRIVLTTGLTSVTTFFPTYTRSGSYLTPTWVSGSVAGNLIITKSTSASPMIGDVAAYIVLG